MEGIKVPEGTDPTPDPNKNSLLRKYDIPVCHLDFDYVAKCNNSKELEKILHILQSGEEGHFPQLMEATEKRLANLKPNSKYIKKVTQVVNKKMLQKEELNELSTELKDWLDDVNKNSKELDNSRKKKTSAIPDVRELKQIKDVQNNDANLKRIKSTDYSSWDKYDPDTEILKMDLEAEKVKKGIETKQKEQNKRTVKFNEFQTKAEAEFEGNREKEKGNEFYKAGEYKQAHFHYTNSINFNPCCVNYNNRAMTNIKLNKYENAVKDCLAALKYESNNIKAVVRLAQSYEALNNIEEAFTTAEKAVRINPNNTIAQNLISKLRRQINGPSNTSRRLKIVEIEETNAKTFKEVNNNKKPIVNYQNHSKREQVLLPIPGPSSMPEPYFVTVENRDPEIIKRQEFILNNRPQMVYLSNVDSIDENDCEEIHVRKLDSKFRDVWNGTRNKNNINANFKSTIAVKDSRHVDIEIKENLEVKDDSGKSNEDMKISPIEDIKTSPKIDIKINPKEDMKISPVENSSSQIVIEEVIDTHENSNSRLELEYARETSNSEEEEFENLEERIAEEPVYIAPQLMALNINSNLHDNGGGGEPHLHPQIQQHVIQIDDIHMPFSFLRVWKSVASDQTYNKHADILRELDFNRISEVIGYKLDGTMLSDIIKTLYLHFTVPHEIERVHTALANLAMVARFNICRMFLSASEKSRVECLLQFLEQHGRPLSPNIKRLYL